MKRLATLLLVLALAACTTIAKVEGDHVVNGKLAVHVSAAWNKINDPWSDEPYDTWTQEGLPLDHFAITLEGTHFPAEVTVQIVLVPSGPTSVNVDALLLNVNTEPSFASARPR